MQGVKNWGKMADLETFKFIVELYAELNVEDCTDEEKEIRSALCKALVRCINKIE